MTDIDASFTFGPQEDPATIGAALRQHGAAMVRGAASALVPLLDRFHASLAKANAGDPDPKFTFFKPAQAGSLYMIGEPDEVASKLGPLPAIAAAYFEAPAAYWDHVFTRMRLVPPTGQQIHGMHQDGAEVSQQPMLTAWSSLTPCGLDAPGLEILRVPHLPWKKLKGERPHWYEGPEDEARAHVLATYGAEKIWRPVMDAGDVVIFNDRIYHQTHVTPEMTATRVSIDIRFTMQEGAAGQWIGR